MTHPAPTLFMKDLISAAITPVSFPLIVDDQHNPGAAYNLDGIDDRFTSLLTPMGNGVTKFSVGFWVKMNATSGGGNYVVVQRATVPGGTVYDLSISRSGANFRVDWTYRVGGSFVGSTSTYGDVPDAINQWNHILCRFDMVAATTDIFVNSLEVTYGAHNTTGGTPPVITSGVKTLGIGSVFNDSYLAGLDGTVSRLAFWNGSFLSDAEILSFNNEEVAAIGEGFGLGPKDRIIQQIIEPVYENNGVIGPVYN